MVYLRNSEIAFLEDRSDTMLYPIHAESLENRIFKFLLFLVTAAVGHLGLPSRINLKGFHLEIILIEFD